MAGSIGATVGPFIFGIVANVWSFASVFQATGVLVMIGIEALGFASMWQRRAMPVG